MNIDKAQLAGDPKKIGSLKGKPIFQVVTKGGFHMILTPKAGGFETLGTGPHVAVARHIATKREKEIVWELKKGDYVEPEAFAFILPKYEAMTNEIRALEGK